MVDNEEVDKIQCGNYLHFVGLLLWKAWRIHHSYAFLYLVQSKALPLHHSFHTPSKRKSNCLNFIASLISCIPISSFSLWQIRRKHKKIKINPNSLPNSSNSCKETLFTEYRVVETLTSISEKNSIHEYENPLRNICFRFGTGPKNLKLSRKSFTFS